MSVTVTFVDDPFDASNWKVEDADDLLQLLVRKFGTWPKNARLYQGEVAEINDVTPTCEADIAALEGAEGSFTVVDYPGFGVDTLLYIALAATVVAAFVLKPKIPNASNRGTNSKSPNNELSTRVNNARPNARIPDIFGTVRSTPDMLAFPYTVYVNSKQVELCFMCIGRGQHEIHDCRDGTTDVSQIFGTDVSVWRPNQNILTEPPYFQRGAAITDPLLYPIRNDAVNGQTLDFPRSGSVDGQNDIKFYPDGRAEIASSSAKSFSLFSAGDSLTVSNAKFVDPAMLRNGQAGLYDENSFLFAPALLTASPAVVIGDKLTLNNVNLRAEQQGETNVDIYIPITGDFIVTGFGTYTDPLDDSEWTTVTVSGANWHNLGITYNRKRDSAAFDVNDAAVLYNLNGTYTAATVTDKVLTFDNPASSNPDWNDIPSGGSPNSSADIGLDEGLVWVGPFIIDDPKTSVIISNFVAPNGLYADNGEISFPLYVLVQLELTPVDADHNPTGPAVIHQTTVAGLWEGPYLSERDSKGATLLLNVPPGRYRVRASRQTPNFPFPGFQMVQEIKWRDIYGATEVTGEAGNFGNLTVVRSRTIATEGALSLKERKLNLLVTRQINLRIGGQIFTEGLYSTNRADEILSFVASDPRIGNRLPSEVDYDNIYNQIAEATAYFGTPGNVEFCYTFDEDSMTFEETFASIAQAVFCVAYRQGSLIRIKFEKRTEDSTILFNHRNKLPGSEIRTVTFGPASDWDGVAFSYTSPEDDAIITQYIPEDRTARNEKRIESIGIRNMVQAHTHAWRQFQKIKYQNQTVSFSATQEAELAIITDRILVADNTRPDTQDGEVLNVAGLAIETSQDVSFDPGAEYTLFLQLYNGTIQAMPCYPVAGDPRAVLMGAAPAYPLIFGDDRYAKTTYAIVRNDDTRQTAFLLTERTSAENTTSDLTAVNYDERYYEHDNDFFPPIDRNLYFTSKPYHIESEDAWAVSVNMEGIRPDPGINVADEIAMRAEFRRFNLRPKATNYNVFAKDEVSMRAQFRRFALKETPRTYMKDAWTPVPTLAIEMPDIIVTSYAEAWNVVPTMTIERL